VNEHPSTGELTFLVHNVAMSKKIDSALKSLVKALEKHAAAVSDHSASKGKVSRASANVRAAAAAYASAAYAKSKAESPFTDIPDPKLSDDTVASLRAERDALRAKKAAASK
jgi:hypothetical protein